MRGFHLHKYDFSPFHLPDNDFKDLFLKKQFTI
jgi:hypothetical protein